jgi:hypothetical protein
MWHNDVEFSGEKCVDAFLPFIMQKQNNKISPRGRQRQKLNRKMLLIIASFSGCLIVGIIIFFKTSRVDQSMAAGSTYMVTEDAPVIEMTLDAPVLKTSPPAGPNMLLVRAVKYDLNNEVNDNH